MKLSLKWRDLRWAWVNRKVPPAQAVRRAGYHSQFGQDYFVEQLFQSKRGGVFVDVGAADGLQHSNTLYLERELGWTGLLVEPNANCHASIEANRKAPLVKACAAAEDGVVRFSQVVGADAQLSGIASKYTSRQARRVRRAIESRGGRVNEVQLPAVNIQRVLQQRGIRQIDYLDIDTEGGELEILQAINLRRYSVACIGIENNNRTLEIRRYLTAQGYRLAAVMGCDEMYVSAAGQQAPSRAA